MSEHARAEKAFAQNRERLKAARLAQEVVAGLGAKEEIQGEEVNPHGQTCRLALPESR